MVCPPEARRPKYDAREARILKNLQNDKLLAASEIKLEI